MTHLDPDLTAVRHVPPAMAEPTDASVSRTWHTISSRRAAADRSRHRPYLRWAVPVAAAVTVGVLTVGGISLLRPDGSKQAGAPQVVLPSPGFTKEIEPNTAPASPQAIAALNALAEKAAQTQPVTIPAGKLIFVRHDGAVRATNIGLGGGATANDGTVAGTAKPTAADNSGAKGKPNGQVEIREIWLDPQGAIALKITDGVTDFTKGPKANNEAQVAERRQQLAANGPSLTLSTPQWLAALPTDPAALLAVLREQCAQEGAAWSVDHRVWNTMNELYATSELALTPQIRAALLRAFTGLHGLTTTQVTVNGQRLVAIRHTEKSSGDEIYFDAATGRAVGRGSVYDGNANYQATWVQSIVDGL